MPAFAKAAVVARLFPTLAFLSCSKISGAGVAGFEALPLLVVEPLPRAAPLPRPRGWNGLPPLPDGVGGADAA